MIWRTRSPSVRARFSNIAAARGRADMIALTDLPAPSLILEALTCLVCTAAIGVLIWHARQRRIIRVQIAAMVEREAGLQRAALIDPVTGLKNRMAFSRDLETLLDSTERAEIAVLF